ncbi:hypothetical protein LF296_12585 [Acinetobacter vivianii]|uniref:Uncharacterized protein n=1 Tax=Acinetobacter vivianii TaxID=1776742 RepID=A0AAJ6NH79_9GAMM|nr:hypothetical protein [Acinetobacter vivianii]WDZ50157.1 hypothetical protein LF296_12585 [Acinetobacter vivianii]
MKKDIRVLVIDTCGWITSISIVIFFFTLWLYSYNNIQEPLKESWSIAFNSLSALATIGAAIIAANLFTDWRDSQKYQNKLNNYRKLCSLSDNFIELLNTYIEALWSVRVNSTNVQSYVDAHSKLSDLKYKLRSELNISKIYFKKINFDEVQNLINTIEYRIENIPPLKIENEIGVVDLIYIEENGGFLCLYFEFKNLIYNTIKPGIETLLKDFDE